MRCLAQWQNIVPAFCCVMLFAASARADNDVERAPANVSHDLSPVTMDDRYMKNDLPAAQPTGTLTLHGAVEEAAVHNRDVLEGKLQVSRFKWDYLATQLNRLPDLRAISYLSQNTLPGLVDPARANGFFFLSAMFPVTQQYRIGLEARAINFQREIAVQRLRQQMDDTRALVKAAYYKLAVDQSLLSDIQDSISYLSDLQKTVANEVTQGNSLKVEEMEVAARLAKSRLDETKARNAYSIDRETFNHLLGRNLKSDVKLEAIPPIDDLELHVEQAEQRALAMRPEMQETSIRVKQLRLEKKVILSQYIPNVSVGVIYIATPGFNAQLIPRNVLAPGIFVTWNAFDWGHKFFLAQGRGRAEQAAELVASNTRDQVLIDLHKQINQLTETRQAVDAAQIARAAARERMRVSINRYKFTSEKLSEVLESQSNLSHEQDSYHQALLAFWQARAEFERAVGSEQ